MAFEALLNARQARPSRIKQMMFTGSLVIHAAALAIGVAYSLWEVDEMALPAIQVMLADAPPPPPPPPPPPAGKKSSTKPKTTKVTKAAEIVQPKENKEQKKPEPEPEEDKDEPEKGGEKGGVAGGVAGGVVGGVVGAPAPKVERQTVTSAQARALLAINPGASPYCCVKAPGALKRLGSLTAGVQVCVSATGQVTDARIVRGANPKIDPQIPGLIRRWRYRPLMVGGKATPFCYSLNYVMDLGS